MEGMKAANEYYLSQYGVAPLVQPQAQYQGPIYDPTTLDYESTVGGEFDFGSDDATYAQVGYGSNDLAALEGGNQAAGAVNQEAMLEELDGMVGEGSEPQADPLSLLQEIKEELKKPETKAALSDDQIDDFEDRISDLSAEARKSGANFDEIMGSIEELKETIGGA